MLCKCNNTLCYRNLYNATIKMLQNYYKQRYILERFIYNSITTCITNNVRTYDKQMTTVTNMC